jgi:hypothetical protein
MKIISFAQKQAVERKKRCLRDQSEDCEEMCLKLSHIFTKYIHKFILLFKSSQTHPSPAVFVLRRIGISFF